MLKKNLRLVVVSILCLKAFSGSLYAQTEKVLVFGPAAHFEILKKSFKEVGLDARKLTEQGLRELSVNEGRLLIVAADNPLSPESRPAIHNFLRSGGNLFVIGTEAFNYAPEIVNPVTVVNFDKPSNYRIQYPVRKEKVASQDNPKIKVLTGSGKASGIELKSQARGMKDVMVQFPVREQSSPSRTVLTFKAKGNHYMDLLALELIDQIGGKWLAFVPISKEWSDYSISLADFIPENWSDPNKPYPFLQPEKIDSLAFGTNLLTVWGEKPMEFSVRDVSLASNKKGVYAPTSSLMALRLPFKENKIASPAWIFDPFFKVRREKSSITLQRKEAYPFGNSELRGVSNTALLSDLVEFPGSLMGTDTKKDYDKKTDREKRSMPLYQALDSRGYSVGDVAKLDIHAGGVYKGAGIAAFGFNPTSISAQSEVLNSLVQAAAYVLQKPKVLAVKMNTSRVEPVQPELSVTLQNPTDKKVNGKLIVEVEGLAKTEVDVSVEKRSTSLHAVTLPVVPQSFSFKKFKWLVSFNSAQGIDRLVDSVDVERSMLTALRHLVTNQKMYPDGRYSNHYFGDAYGVRAMFAYLNYLKRNPQSLARNKDIWQTISPKDIEESGLRFCDMLVQRQHADGSIPMGYSEHTRGYNIADGGQIALSMAQLSQYVSDKKKRSEYLAFCRRFVDWSETFYIDSTRSAKLMAQPGTKASEAKAGLYGLGMSGNRKRETGPAWVLSDILAVQLFLGYADSGARGNNYRFIADRNAKFYVNSMYDAAGYYQAEALFWTWIHSKDPHLKAKIQENLEKTFLPPLYKGKPDDMYDIGSRSTLRALSMLYYNRLIKEDSDVRAALLKYVWSFGSGSSSNSMAGLSRTFGKAVHGESLSASKYAALSSLWAMELLDPGSTLAGHVQE